MKKKYTLVILSLFLIGMTGCGNKETASTIEEPTVIESTVVEETTEIESTVSEEPTEIESTVVEETTETVMTEEISTDISTDVSAEVEPYIMYTNTNCNIRSGASADSDVIGLYDINVEVEVIGIEGDWSKLVYDGCIAYIKSSLLSDAPVKTSSKGSTSTGSGKGGSSTASSSGSASSSAEDPSIQALREKLAANSGGRAEDDRPEFHSSFEGMTDEERKAEEQKLADYIQEHNVYVQ